VVADWRYAIARRLEGLALPPAREAEVVEELSQHLDDRYAELRSEGADEEGARRDALAELDEADLVRELTGVEAPRVEPLALGGSGGAAGIAGGAWNDLRFGARMLVKDAGASFVIVLTLGLAIAANAIVFGFTDLLLLRPLPIRNAARLVAVSSFDRHQSSDRQPVSLPDYLEIKAQATTFEDALAMTSGPLSLTGTGEPLAVGAAHVTANLFRLWDVPPVAGRLLRPGEDAPGHDRVAVLAHHFWMAHFAGDPAVVGRALTLNGRSYTVVGVVTPDVELGTLAQIDVWVPLETSLAAARDERTLAVMGLLKPGATLDAANAELATISDRLQQSYPATNGGLTLHAITLRDSTVGRSTWIFLSLLGVVVGLVLLVACANVATVMLARAGARRREIAVRLALGATRARLVRQLISEGVLLGLASGMLGVLFAYGGLTAFKALSPELIFQRLAINTHLLLFAFALSILTPILFGLVPALQSSRPDLNEDLKDGGRDASSAIRGNRSRAMLLVAQVAFALAVLIVSGLIVRAVRAIERAPLGINPDGLLATRVRLDPPIYEDDAARMRTVEAILDRLSAVPGVTSATATIGFPVVDVEPIRHFAIAGAPATRPNDAPWACEAAVFGDYARTLGIPILEGRQWEPGDRASGWAVAVVNREAVRRYWPSRSPLGERITMLDAKGEATGPAIQIVGVVDNVIGSDATEPPPPRVYRPIASRPLESVAFMARTSGDAASMAPVVRDALRTEDRDLAVSNVRTVQAQVDNFLRIDDLIMLLFVGFAAVGLVVAIAGVYGVTAFSVGQRRHEIGVRVALGATASHILNLIAKRTFRLIGIGAVLGVLSGWIIGLTMRSLLPGVGATDPAIYAAVLALVALCGFIATYVPAYRAMSIDPMAVLKRD
jgi:putative ABC transport system permease protein